MIVQHRKCNMNMKWWIIVGPAFRGQLFIFISSRTLVIGVIIKHILTSVGVRNSKDYSPRPVPHCPLNDTSRYNIWDIYLWWALMVIDEKSCEVVPSNLMPPPPPPPVPPPIAPSARLLLPKACRADTVNIDSDFQDQNFRTSKNSAFLAIVDAKTPKLLSPVDIDGLKRMLSDRVVNSGARFFYIDFSVKANYIFLQKKKQFLSNKHNVLHYISSMSRNCQNLPKLNQPSPEMHHLTQKASVFRVCIVMQFE